MVVAAHVLVGGVELVDGRAAVGVVLGGAQPLQVVADARRAVQGQAARQPPGQAARQPARQPAARRELDEVQRVLVVRLHDVPRHALLVARRLRLTHAAHVLVVTLHRRRRRHRHLLVTMGILREKKSFSLSVSDILPVV